MRARGAREAVLDEDGEQVRQLPVQIAHHNQLLVAPCSKLRFFGEFIGQKNKVKKWRKCRRPVVPLLSFFPLAYALLPQIFSAGILRI